VGAQVVDDGVHGFGVGWQPGVDLLQEVDPVGGRPPRVWRGERLAGGRPEGAEDGAPAPAAVVDLLPGAGTGLGGQRDEASAGEALGPSGPISSRQTTALPGGGVV
jgi:hypothetical protein